MATRKRQLISGDEAAEATRQHTTPCGDCPWARTALPGWLGGFTAAQWIANVHGESFIACHTLIRKDDPLGAQCAGAAIYRANVCKVPRSPQALRLPADRETVFARPTEFLLHHGEKLTG